MFSLFFQKLFELNLRTELLEILNWDEEALESLLQAWADPGAIESFNPDELVAHFVSLVPPELEYYSELIKVFLKNSLLPFIIDNMGSLNQGAIGEC